MPRQDIATRSPSSLSQGDPVPCEKGAFQQLENTTDCTEETLSLEQKVASQLERYLSDGHLAQDGFLLKHVQRDKLRYVSLKLLTSFSKIRKLTRDWRVTAAAARASPLLQLNAEGTKVRRGEPPPTWLLAAPTSRLLLACNLSGLQARGDTPEPPEPLEPPRLLENILRVFGAYGDITSVRVLRPGKAVPLDLRHHARTHRELGRDLCAVVEFHSLEGSRRAHRALAAEGGAPDDGGGGGGASRGRSGEEPGEVSDGLEPGGSAGREADGKPCASASPGPSGRGVEEPGTSYRGRAGLGFNAPAQKAKPPVSPGPRPAPRGSSPGRPVPATADPRRLWGHGGPCGGSLGSEAQGGGGLRPWREGRGDGSAPENLTSSRRPRRHSGVPARRPRQGETSSGGISGSASPSRRTLGRSVRMEERCRYMSRMEESLDLDVV